MTSFRSTLSSAATALGMLWAAGGCRALGNPTLMHYGFLEVRVRGQGIDTTCRTDAHYRYSGLLNSTTTGWIIQDGWADDAPPGRTVSRSEPDPWCRVMLTMSRPLKAGISFHTDSPDPETSLVRGTVLSMLDKYRSSASPGVLHVDESSRKRIRGRFHLTLPRFADVESGPPVELEGRFEVRRDP